MNKKSEMFKTDPTLVVRSDVPKLQDYTEYKPYLSHDFFYACAYCTMSESEAEAIRFCIDHYESQIGHPALVNQYDNLMYCCEECNSRKGDRDPPEAARIDGYRFFRPDADIRREHFETDGTTLEHKTNTGFFTKEALDLNRRALKKLREIRARLDLCEEFIAQGIMTLRSFHIDQLPKEIRTKANHHIKEALSTHQYLAEQIDSLLRSYARSSLADDEINEEEAERKIERMKNLKNLESLYPGKWRGRDKAKK